jgi:hypothetical protein
MEKEGVRIREIADYFLPQQFNTLKVKAMGPDGFVAAMTERWQRVLAVQVNDHKLRVAYLRSGGSLDALHLAPYDCRSLGRLWGRRRWERYRRNHRNGWLDHVRRQVLPQGGAALRQIRQASEDHALAAINVHLGRHNDFRVCLGSGWQTHWSVLQGPESLSARRWPNRFHGAENGLGEHRRRWAWRSAGRV